VRGSRIVSIEEWRELFRPYERADPVSSPPESFAAWREWVGDEARDLLNRSAAHTVQPGLENDVAEDATAGTDFHHEPEPLHADLPLGLYEMEQRARRAAMPFDEFLRKSADLIQKSR